MLIPGFANAMSVVEQVLFERQQQPFSQGRRGGIQGLEARPALRILQSPRRRPGGIEGAGQIGQ